MGWVGAMAWSEWLKIGVKRPGKHASVPTLLRLVEENESL
jgi:hypothetical protein